MFKFHNFSWMFVKDSNLGKGPVFVEGFITSSLFEKEMTEVNKRTPDINLIIF